MKKVKTNIPFSTRSLATSLVVIMVVLISCKKYLPEDRENIGSDSQFTKVVYEPVLGRTTLFSENFYQGSTSFPATFTIVNPRRRNGDAAPELTDLFPVKVWKKPYTGDETSLTEIEDKRAVEYRPLLEVFPHSGQFAVWAEAKDAFIRSQPDSGYMFDVELSNTGGRRFFRNLFLKPMKERPYEPSNYDPITGQPLANGVSASQIHIKGVNKDRYLSSGDVDVYIRKRSGNDPQKTTNTLRFMFLDSLYHPMNPALFSTTDWEHLVHGFNMKMSDSDVVYDVAYPIPLAAIPTRYTSPGFAGLASVVFRFPRLGFGGLRDDGVIGLNFAIYEPGDWEIVFAFKTDNPKFSND